jgi:hypothetical protein
MKRMTTSSADIFRPKEFESMVNRDGSRSYNDKNLLLGGCMRVCRLGR